MRLDVVTIFPEYLAPLKLSLLGKAQEEGLLEINIHDLRAHSTNNHHSVDDTPYGGGAGMVMKAEVWGSALDPLMVDDVDLIVLTPGGKRFNQRMAEDFSRRSHLVFACGRYEGIDDRVRQYYSQDKFVAQKVRVHEVSIGDYVLGGGEVAAMVMIEAITRLLPGVLGNPESIVEESHMHEGFAEHPAFTKPQTWRGIAVPEILLSGNHAQIAAWRAQSAKDRAEKNF
jgi:tRNA (guanine37-N1)-methyltransferase